MPGDCPILICRGGWLGTFIGLACGKSFPPCSLQCARNGVAGIDRALVAPIITDPEGVRSYFANLPPCIGGRITRFLA
jgi:hypothetical protein